MITVAASSRRFTPPLLSRRDLSAARSPKSGVVVQNVMFQIERLWVRSLAPAAAATTTGEGGEGSKDTTKEKQTCATATGIGTQTKPSSPSTATAATAAAVTTSATKGENTNDGGMVYDSRSVLSPTLLHDTENPSTTSACTTCQQNFAPEDNAWDSCRCVRAGAHVLTYARFQTVFNSTLLDVNLVCRKKTDFQMKFGTVVATGSIDPIPAKRPVRIVGVDLCITVCLMTGTFLIRPGFMGRSTAKMAFSYSMAYPGNPSTPPRVSRGERTRAARTLSSLVIFRRESGTLSSCWARGIFFLWVMGHILPMSAPTALTHPQRINSPQAASGPVVLLREGGPSGDGLHAPAAQTEGDHDRGQG